jgi:hypothetical protein
MAGLTKEGLSALIDAILLDEARTRLERSRPDLYYAAFGTPYRIQRRLRALGQTLQRQGHDPTPMQLEEIERLEENLVALAMQAKLDELTSWNNWREKTNVVNEVYALQGEIAAIADRTRDFYVRREAQLLREEYEWRLDFVGLDPYDPELPEFLRTTVVRWLRAAQAHQAQGKPVSREVKLLLFLELIHTKDWHEWNGNWDPDGEHDQALYRGLDLAQFDPPQYGRKPYVHENGDRRDLRAEPVPAWRYDPMEDELVPYYYDALPEYDGPEEFYWRDGIMVVTVGPTQAPTPVKTELSPGRTRSKQVRDISITEWIDRAE